jgi:hypothetical protein
MLAAQSGVYWLYPEPEQRCYCRGFDRDSLDHEAVLDAYAHGQHSTQAAMTRFVTMGSALQNAWDKWGTWVTAPRALDLDPEGTKREDISRTPWADYPPHTMLVPTRAKFNHAPNYPSSPYVIPWRQRMSVRQLEDVEIEEHEQSLI